MEHNATREQEFEAFGAMTLARAEGLTIATQADYEKSADMLREIKAREKQIAEYWKAPKKAAQDAHKTLVEREAQMLRPYKAAESAIKAAMLDYNARAEKARQEAAEAARIEAEAEAARYEAAAEAAEEQGDAEAAELLRDMAAFSPLPVREPAPGPKGVTARKTWKARVIRPEQVPAYFDGIELRTINMAALNTLAEWHRDKVIPGVEFYEDTTMSVRA